MKTIYDFISLIQVFGKKVGQNLALLNLDVKFFQVRCFMKKKVLLMILDGWGYSTNRVGNAVADAKTPFLDALESKYGSSFLLPSGLAVGLEDGTMGNSEVGHLNIGAGRIVYQLNTLIDKAIATGEFDKNEALNKAIDNCLKSGSNLHIMGLLSDGKVHSNPKHLLAFLKLANSRGLSSDKIFYHLITDGRDTLPNSGKGFVQEFLDETKDLCQVASVCGRYWAMDRDNRWDRVEKAYNCFVNRQGKYFDNPVDAVESSYADKVTDEFIKPCVIDNTPGVKDDDSLFFFNFRADRARQISYSFLLPEFGNFERNEFKNLCFVSMSPYDVHLEDYLSVAFRLPALKNILGEVVGDCGLKQLRIAETEKYAHVTFFFNGTREEPFAGEDRILIPSPKVASYDLQPEMSAYEVADALLEQLQAEKYQMVICNLANCDMVGHTGDFEATKRAVETVDDVLSKIIPTALSHEYEVLITADHGNAEKMLNENGEVFTAHTTSPVKIILAGNGRDRLTDGKLGDIAPTILELMGIDKPAEMTGNSLLKS